VTVPLRLKLVDAALYAVVLTAVWAVLFLPLSLLLSGDLVGVKWGLFIAGLFALGVGSFKLRPGKRWKADDDDGLVAGQDGLISDSRGESQVQRLVDRCPPFRDRPLRDDQRLSDGLKLLLGAVCMLLTSFLLEALLGVGVATPA
jgi:hypothetical protein